MKTDRDPSLTGDPRRNDTLRHILIAIPATLCLIGLSTGLIVFVSSI